jgi:membrane protease YdiL (CAAX protease family)
MAVALLWRGGFRGASVLYAGPGAAARGVAWLEDVSLGLATGLAVVVLSDIATRSTRWGEALARTLAETLGPLRLRDCVLLAVLSGVAEEALFRGAIQPELGLVTTSLVFGLAHLVPRRELLPWTAFTVLAGFLLGGLYLWTGNLVAPVVTHVVVNGVNLRRLTRDLELADPASAP